MAGRTQSSCACVILHSSENCEHCTVKASIIVSSWGIDVNRFVNYFLAALLSVLAGNAHAQEHNYLEEPQRFTGGLVAGMNLAQVDGDMYFGYTKMGFTGGAFVKMGLASRLLLSTEILFSQKGSKGNAVLGTPLTGTSTAICYIGLSYVETPVTLQYKFPMFTLEAGASWSYLVRIKEWIEAQPSVVINDENNRFEKMGLDYVFGASRKLSKHVVASLRYQYSMIPIRPAARVPYGYSYGTKGQFNNLFGFRLQYEW